MYGFAPLSAVSESALPLVGGPTLASITFTGTGQLTLVPTRLKSASATFGGTGALATTPTRLRSGAVAFNSAGAVVLTPSAVRARSAAFAGAGALLLVPLKLSGAPAAAPVAVGGLPLNRVRQRPAPQPVVPQYVPVDSASYDGLVRALWHVADEVTPTPQPYTPVARAGRPVPQRVRTALHILTRRSPAVLPLAEPVDAPVERRATAPPAAPPERRRRREYVPVPLPEPVHPEEPPPGPAAPVAPPPSEPEPEPVVPFQPDAAEAARVAAAIEELTAAPAAAILPVAPRVVPWDEEEADTVALLLGLLLEA